MRVNKYRPIVLSFSGAAREVAVQQEIGNFLRALRSYPERFAHQPDLSFEQHLISIMAETQPASGSSGSNRS